MNKIALITLIIVALGIIGYLILPLFISKTVSEASPSQNVEEIVSQGSFQDADSFHKVEGQAKIIELESQKYLRLENFKSTNGPDLKVYLAEETNANSYVSLGELKGNIGDQNYLIPEGTDLEKYNKVLIWCEQFSVLFGSAQLS